MLGCSSVLFWFVMPPVDFIQRMLNSNTARSTSGDLDARTAFVCGLLMGILRLLLDWRFNNSRSRAVQVLEMWWSKGFINRVRVLTTLLHSLLNQQELVFLVLPHRYKCPRLEEGCTQSCPT